jgi:hypothetical protein
MDNITNGNWSAYPNPADDILTINIGNSNMGYNYMITDVMGRTVLQGVASGNTANIDVSQLSAGTYIIRIDNDGERIGEALFMKN